jgi:hypothetical protein
VGGLGLPPRRVLLLIIKSKNPFERHRRFQFSSGHSQIRLLLWKLHSTQGKTPTLYGIAKQGILIQTPEPRPPIVLIFTHRPNSTWSKVNPLGAAELGQYSRAVLKAFKPRLYIRHELSKERKVKTCITSDNRICSRH